MLTSAQLRNYKIPQDVVMDIFRIISNNHIPYKIKGVREKENLLILEVDFSEVKHGDKARENIESILNEYTECMKGLLWDSTLIIDNEEEEENDL